MKKFALALAGAGCIAAGALAFAPSANAAPQQKIGCYIVTPNGNVATVSVAVVAFENTNNSNGVPMPWNCMQ